jgi:hypothetical protein
MSLNKVGKGFYISKSPAICKGGFSFILLLLSKPLLNRERKKKTKNRGETGELKKIGEKEQRKLKGITQSKTRKHEGKSIKTSVAIVFVISRTSYHRSFAKVPASSSPSVSVIR